MKRILPFLSLALGTFCLQAQNHNVPQNGLVAFYLFDGNAADSSTNRKDGTVHSSPFVADRFGATSKAAYFNGSSAYIDAPTSGAIQPSGSVSLSGWIKPDSTGNINTVISKRFSLSADPFHSYTFYFDPAKARWCFAISKGIAGTLKVLPAKMAQAWGSWMHFAATYDGSNMKIYFNGDMDTSMAFTGNLGYGSVSLYMGYSGSGTDYYKGAIDDITIYNRALTAVEITAMANGTVGIGDADPATPNISVFPVPAGDELFVNLPASSQPLPFRITNLTGQVVLEGTTTGRIQLGGVTKGIYFLNLFATNKPAAVKFVKE